MGWFESTLIPAEQATRHVFASAAMCYECVKIDETISHYRRLAERATDEKTLAGIDKLVEELTARKAALHPEQEQ